MKSDAYCKLKSNKMFRIKGVEGDNRKFYVIQHHNLWSFGRMLNSRLAKIQTGNCAQYSLNG